jgi:hypothetical protein
MLSGVTLVNPSTVRLFVIFILLLVTSLSARFNAEYLFNLFTLSMLSNRFTANAFGRFSNLFEYFSLHFFYFTFHCSFGYLHGSWNNTNKIKEWAKNWRIKVNQNESTHISFTIRNRTCPTVQIGNVVLPQNNEAKYLDMHLDRRLTWAKHIKAKRNQLNSKVKKMYWLLGRGSTLSSESKLLLYKAELKPFWTYGHSAMGDSLKFQH